MSVDTTTRQQGWAAFTDRAEALGATVLRAATPADVATVLSSAGEYLAVTASLADAYPALAAGRARAESGPAPEVAALGRFAVAETGSVGVDEPRADRGACFLADRLWLVVPVDTLVRSIDEALAHVRGLVESGAHHPLLMSGPSRTADIERVLTVGVHGPRALVLVVVGAA
jgi:L-lactate dehydrogenase complex protein LldG